MRPPRFRFPDEVRSATRSMATRMVQDGKIAQNEDDLAAWIERDPETRRVMEDGGYGQEFTAGDVFPLLEVFVVQAGGKPAEPDPEPISRGNRWMWSLMVAVVILLAMVAVASGLI